MNYYLAVDIGASSGRHILGWIENGKLQLEEIYRFENLLIEKDGQICWDIENLWNQVKNGIVECGKRGIKPVAFGIDTWAVDFVLLDESGKLIGNSVAYRDSRTDKIMDEVWDYNYAAETRTVDVHIKTLRHKLGVASKLIETIRGVGYKIID